MCSLVGEFGPDHVGRKDAAFAVHLPQEYLGDKRGTSPFSGGDMREAIENDRIAAPAVHGHPDYVAHGATGQEQSRFLATEIGDQLLEVIDRRIFASLFVPDLCLGHCLTHTLGWFGGGIAGEINHWLLVLCRARNCRWRDSTGAAAP